MERMREMNEQRKKWPVIYPAYIDADKTIAQGRKVSKEDSVKFPMKGMMQVNTQNGPMPVDKTAVDIAQATALLGLQGMIESKAYSRDILMRGRVRVQIMNEDGTPCKPEITNRKQLYRAIAGAVKENLKNAPKMQPPPQTKQQAKSGGGSNKKGKKKKK